MTSPNAIPLPASRSGVSVDENAIGSFLVKRGVLNAEDIEQIIELQREANIRFGEAALRLGLLEESELRYALSRQFNYSYVLPADGYAYSEELVAALDPFGDRAEQFRCIRSQLLLSQGWASGKKLRFSLVGPSRGDGRSYLAANLAITFAQLGARTLLIDADLRMPRLHRMFGLDTAGGLSCLLASRGGDGIEAPIPSLGNLDVMPAGPLPPNPLELLSQPACGDVLDKLAFHYDVVLVDTPPFREGTDAHMVSVWAGEAVAVARNNATSLDAFETMVAMLIRSGVAVIGSVLNDPAATTRPVRRDHA